MPKTVTPVTNIPCIIASTLKPIIAILNPIPITHKTKGKYMDNTCYNNDSILTGANGYCTKILFDEVESNTKYKITAIEGTVRTIVTYFDEINIAIKTEKAETNMMEFITPENCAKIRVGFLNSNKQEAINEYKLGKTV